RPMGVRTASTTYTSRSARGMAGVLSEAVMRGLLDTFLGGGASHRNAPMSAAAARAPPPCRGGNPPPPEPRVAAGGTRPVHEHRWRLARVARAEGLPAEEAFDAVQEAFASFLVLPRAKEIGESPDDARKMLVALTRNVARNGRRLHAHARPHLSDEAAL